MDETFTEFLEFSFVKLLWMYILNFLSLELASHRIKYAGYVWGKWKPAIGIVICMLSNINIIIGNQFNIKKWSRIHWIGPKGWIITVFFKIYDFLHGPHLHVNVCYPLINNIFFVTSFFSRCIWAPIDVKLIRILNHWCRVPLND